MKKELIYLLGLVLLYSCSKDANEMVSDNNSDQDTDFYFNLSHTEIISTSLENDFTVNITTNTNWEVKSKPVWLSVSPESGNQNQELQISLEENTDSNARNGEIKFTAAGEDFILDVSQQGFAIKLISYSGSESPINMSESKFLLFNKPVTLNAITSGDPLYSFYAGPDDVEYFADNHGIKFTVGPSNLGSTHSYKFSVSDSDNVGLVQTVNFDFFTQQIIVPGRIKDMILDAENNLWVLSLRVVASSEPSYIFKFVENGGLFEEELRFEVDVDLVGTSYVGGSFFINPYNNYIYIPDYEEEEIDVYSKSGSLIKQIEIPSVDSDHPDYPHTSPVYLGFNNEGKGIVSLQGKGISGMKWRFIDSSDDDLLTEPDETHPYYYNDLQTFIPNWDKSKLYVIEDLSPIIKVFDGNITFGELDLNTIFPSGANASLITQNRLNNKIFISGFHNSQIIASDLSYISNQANAHFLGDFCYDSGRPNNIYAFDGDANFKLLDYDNQVTVLDLPLDSRFNWTNRRGIITTPDNEFVLTYSDRVDVETSRSQIVIYSTAMFD